MLAIFLFIIWIVLNGRITLELCIIGALLSLLLYVFSRKFMPKKDVGEYSFTRNPIKLISYGLYVFTMIVAANMGTLSFLLHPGKKPQPRLVYFTVDLKTDVAKMLLANSITITPGTITVSVEGNRFCVHALDASMAEGIKDSGFIKRLEKMEYRH